MTHIGDDAALYALGLLDEDERLAVDAHVRTCDTCRAILASAEDDVTAIAQADVQHRKPAPSRFAWYALAAVFIVGLVTSTGLFMQNRELERDSDRQQAAIAAMVSTPHRDVAFAGSANAHVMYAADGSWYCIVVPHADRSMHVMWKHDGTATDLGSTHVVGDSGMLYLPNSHPMDQLELVAEQTVVGKAQLVF